MHSYQHQDIRRVLGIIHMLRKEIRSSTADRGSSPPPPAAPPPLSTATISTSKNTNKQRGLPPYSFYSPSPCEQLPSLYFHSLVLICDGKDPSLVCFVVSCVIVVPCFFRVFCMCDDGRTGPRILSDNREQRWEYTLVLDIIYVGIFVLHQVLSPTDLYCHASPAR